MKNKVNLANEPYMIKTTTNATSGYIDVNNVKICDEKANIKMANITYEKYMEVINENEMLKKIIIELNKKLYGGENDK